MNSSRKNVSTEETTNRVYNNKYNNGDLPLVIESQRNSNESTVRIKSMNGTMKNSSIYNRLYNNNSKAKQARESQSNKMFDIDDDDVYDNNDSNMKEFNRTYS